MSDVLDPAPLPQGLGIAAEDCYQTPESVRLVMLTLLKRLETLEREGIRTPQAEPEKFKA